MVLMVGAISCNRDSPNISQSPGGPKNVIPDEYIRTSFPLLCPEECASEDRLVLRLRSRQDVLELVDAVDSLEVKYENGTFLFCTSLISSYTVEKVNIHGWQYNPLNGTWSRMFAVRNYEMGEVGLVFDKDTGVFTAEYAANNDSKGTPVFTFNVNAVWTRYDIDPEGEMQSLR